MAKTDRRSFLKKLAVGAGAVFGAGAIDALLGEKDCEICESHFDSFEFLESTLKDKPIIEIQGASSIEHLDPRTLNNIVQKIQSNEDIKEKWYSSSSTTDVRLTFSDVKEITGYVPESETSKAQAYQNYCINSIKTAWEYCGFKEKELPKIHILQNEKEIPENNGGIVNCIWRIIKGKWTLESPNAGTLKLSDDFKYSERSGVLGGAQVHFTFNKTNKQFDVQKRGYLFSITAQEKQLVLGTPFAEAIHMLLNYQTTKQIKEKMNLAENKEQAEQISQNITRIDEAVAHAVAHQVMRECKNRYKIPVSDDFFEKRAEWYKQNEPYTKVHIAQELLKTESCEHLVKRYISNIESVIRDIEGNK